MVSEETPSLTTGLRGLSYWEVEVTGPNRDLHSGHFGGAVANPINVSRLGARKDPNHLGAPFDLLVKSFEMVGCARAPAHVRGQLHYRHRIIEAAVRALDCSGGLLCAVGGYLVAPRPGLLDGGTVGHLRKLAAQLSFSISYFF